MVGPFWLVGHCTVVCKVLAFKKKTQSIIQAGSQHHQHRQHVIGGQDGDHDDDDDDDDDDDYDDDDDGDDDDVAMMMTWHMPCHRCVENDMKVVHYEPAEGHSQGDLPKNSCKMMRG